MRLWPAAFVIAAIASSPAPAASSPGAGAASAVRFGAWTETSFGSYLAPLGPFVGADGGVDVVFHFHGAMNADKEWRASGVRAVIVNADLGGMSSAFADAMQDPRRLDDMLAEVLLSLQKRMARGDLHPRRLAIVSFSAGYPAAARALESDLKGRIDAVFLLDSLHAPYVDAIPPGASDHGIPFRHLIDEGPLAPFIRFGRDAVLGKKLMVVTHSAILPPDYGSTTEAAFAIAHAIDARIEEKSGKTARGMYESDVSDAGGFHMRGYWGASGADHLAHLAFVGDLVPEWLVRRWNGGG